MKIELLLRLILLYFQVSNYSIYNCSFSSTNSSFRMKPSFILFYLQITTFIVLSFFPKFFLPNSIGTSIIYKIGAYLQYFSFFQAVFAPFAFFCLYFPVSHHLMMTQKQNESMENYMKNTWNSSKLTIYVQCNMFIWLIGYKTQMISRNQAIFYC